MFVPCRVAYSSNHLTLEPSAQVYTFWIYQHLVNLGKYELDLSVYRYDN